MAVAARCQIVPSRVDGLALALASTSVRSEMKTVLFAGTTVAALAAASLAPAIAQATHPSQVVQWNRMLLVIALTPGAQPATIHPTHSFAIMTHNLTTAENARLFALVNLSFADGAMAFYDAKYTYNFWRPVTAIRAAATDGNPETEADPNWLPEVGNTAPDPSYPDAHAVISAAGAEVLTSVLRKRHFEFSVTSEVTPGVRSFTSFPAAAEEATLSRISSLI